MCAQMNKAGLYNIN